MFYFLDKYDTNTFIEMTGDTINIRFKKGC